MSGRARQLPVYECWLNPNWQDSGLATVVVSRKHTTGNITLATYLVDVFCLGLKDTMYFFNMDEDTFEDLLDKLYEGTGQEREETDYIFAHNLVYGGIGYADDLGFSPNKDWKISQYVLEADRDNIELIEIEFGREGMAVYISGPYDNPIRIVNTLKKSVGEGNFDIIFTDGDTYLNRMLQGNTDFSIDELVPEGETGFKNRDFLSESEEEAQAILNKLIGEIGETEALNFLANFVGGIEEKELSDIVKKEDFDKFEDVSDDKDSEKNK